MRYRAILWAGWVTAAILTAAFTTWGWWARPDRSMRNLPLGTRPSANGQRSDEQVETELVEVRRRLESKRAITEDVLAGRLGLLEAAARFRALGGNPDYLMGRPDCSEEERRCRSVLAWVEGATWKEPERSAALRSRLEAELQDHLTRHGKVELSEPNR